MFKLGLNAVKFGVTFALLANLSCFSAVVPDNMQDFINKNFPETNFRFDGMVILPDNTVYLPLIPAKIINPKEIVIKQTIPENKSLMEKPDIIILNNDYVLLKVITDS